MLCLATSGEALPMATNGASPKKRQVKFGQVHILEFAVTIDGSKLPSDGLSPLGLGEWLHAESFGLEDFEAARTMGEDEHQLADPATGFGSSEAALTDRPNMLTAVGSRRGVRRVDDFERRGLLVGYLGSEDLEAVKLLEAVEADNREIRNQNITTYERDLTYEEEESAAAGGWTSLRTPSDKPSAPLYSTAEEGASRYGLGGGFRERDDEEEARRKARALSEKAATETRKAERRRCAGCKRFACIC